MKNDIIYMLSAKSMFYIFSQRYFITTYATVAQLVNAADS